MTILGRICSQAAAWFLVFVAAVVPACDILEFDCLGEVEINVSTDLPPKFDWQPNCEATALWVKNEETDETMWIVEGRFKPPLDYGKVPVGAKSIRQAKTLSRADTYRVGVIGGSHYGVRQMGDKEFVAADR